MHPLAWLVPIKKAFLPSHPPPPPPSFSFQKHRDRLYLWYFPHGIPLPPPPEPMLYLDKLHLFFYLSFPWPFERIAQFVLYRVLYDHVRFSCPICISRPASSSLAELFLIVSTYPHSVRPDGGAGRLYLYDCYTRFMLGYPHIACYCSRLILPLTDVQWRAI